VWREAKVFLNLQGGITRETLSDLEHYEERIEKLSKIIKEQRKVLKSKDHQISEQAQELNKERRRSFKRQNMLRKQREEIFQLKNQLDLLDEPVKDTQDVAPSLRASTKSKTVGALPDFVIIGAQKGGTSSLHYLLTQHPNVERAARKEIHYFDRPERFEKGTEWYRLCFPPPKWQNGQRSITGEASPSYLFHPLVPQRMKQVVPDARLIVLLRNPVIRAYSHYQMSVRSGNATRTFEEVVEAEQAWLLDKGDKTSEDHSDLSHQHMPNFLARGIYVDQLQRWSTFFDDKQMLVLRSEDFFQRTTDTLKKVQGFLNLPYREVSLGSRATNHRYEPMNPATKRQLEDYFKPHNQRLYEHLGVDFGW
jgi:hypothetical protein